MEHLQESKDLIMIFDWETLVGQVTSFFPNSHVHVVPERHMCSQCKCLLFFIFQTLKLKSVLLAQLIGLKYLVAKV